MLYLVILQEALPYSESPGRERVLASFGGTLFRAITHTQVQLLLMGCYGLAGKPNPYV